jgi:hypothetical protein
MRRPRVRRDLAQLSADLKQDLALHQRARDQHNRLAHEILQTALRTSATRSATVVML